MVASEQSGDGPDQEGFPYTMSVHSIASRAEHDAALCHGYEVEQSPFFTKTEGSFFYFRKRVSDAHDFVSN